MSPTTYVETKGHTSYGQYAEKVQQELSLLCFDN